MYAWGKGATPALQVAHALPSQESRAREPVAELICAHVEVRKSLLPDLLLTCDPHSGEM